MTDTGESPERSPSLDGWKEIAQYLRKGVRTVQRYERELGLPVRRPAGKPKASVMAFKTELDDWANTSPTADEMLIASPERLVRVELGKNVREMQLLRQQMESLRRELKTSIEMIRNSIQNLRERNQDQGREVDRLRSLGFDLRGQRLILVPSRDRGRRKIN